MNKTITIVQPMTDGQILVAAAEFNERFKEAAAILRHVQSILTVPTPAQRFDGDKTTVASERAGNSGDLVSFSFQLNWSPEVRDAITRLRDKECEDNNTYHWRGEEHFGLAIGVTINHNDITAMSAG